jgi:hypothetical protein
MSTRNRAKHGAKPLPPRPWHTDPHCGVVDANGEPVGMYHPTICQKVVEIFNAEHKRAKGKR